MGAVVVGDLEGPLDGTVSDVEPLGELDITQAPLEGTTVDRRRGAAGDRRAAAGGAAGLLRGGGDRRRGRRRAAPQGDRPARRASVDGLTALGGDIEATADGFVVRGTGGLRGGVIDAHGDHRMAMLGAVAGLGSREGVEVVGMEAAAVSYPGFESDLATLAM